MRSITYWHPCVYSLFMRLQYKLHYAERYKVIRDLIDDNSCVVDVCCGDCKMYDFLRDKEVEYTGLDFNQFFIKYARKKGIKAKIFNVYKDVVPGADYIILQASLYQFFPWHGQILNKLFGAARKYLIISEPVKTFGGSDSKFISFIGKVLNNPGNGIKTYRFSIDTLKNTLRPFERNITKELLISNNREYVVLIKKDS